MAIKILEEIYVLMPTYNHVDYIAEAVEGVMSQVVDVPLVLVIRDDASNDGTTGIVRDFKKKYKRKIKLILKKKNQFPRPPGPLGEVLDYVSKTEKRVSIVRGLLNPKSERHVYVALCEGDDYWHNPNKLQVQVDRMREHKQVNLIHHGVDIKVEPGGNKDYAEELGMHLRNFEGTDLRVFGSYFRFSHNVMTCSALFRLSALDLGQYKKKPIGSLGDWVLFALLCRDTEPIYLPERFATYRVRPDSIWSSKSKYERENTSKLTDDFLRSALNNTITGSE